MAPLSLSSNRWLQLSTDARRVRALNEGMKTLLALLIAALPLVGCVAVPVEPGPVVYAAPAPAVVFAPRPYYYHRGGPYWRRGWR
jgi:hypothetical protein